MKGTVFTDIGLVLTSFIPMVLHAQDAERPSKINLPEIEVRMNKDQVQSPVKETFQQEYGLNHKPLIWVKDDLIMPEQDNETKVIAYTLRSKASNGSTLYVNYSPEGKRISSKEVLRNLTPAEPVINTLRDSEFKDWVIKRNVTVRKVSNGGAVKERNYLTLKKGKNKKVLCLDENGRVMNNLQKEFAAR